MNARALQSVVQWGGAHRADPGTIEPPAPDLVRARGLIADLLRSVGFAIEARAAELGKFDAHRVTSTLRAGFTAAALDDNNKGEQP